MPALAWVRDHTSGGVSSTSSTTVSGALTALVPADQLLVVYVGYGATAAGAPQVNSLAVPSGERNTWSQVASHVATGAGGVRGEMWAIKTTMPWASGFSLTVTLSAVATYKSMEIVEFVGDAVALDRLGNVIARKPAISATSAVGTPSVTSGNPNVGDLVLAGATWKSDALPTGDSDTLGGAWSTPYRVTPAAGTPSCASMIQWKIATVTTAQVYNPTNNSVSSGAAIAVLRVDTPTPPIATATKDFLTTFGSDTAGTIPAAFVRHANYGSAATWAVTADAAATGGKVLRASGAAAFRLLGISAFAQQSDTDLTVKVRTDTPAAQGPGVVLGGYQNTAAARPDGARIGLDAPGTGASQGVSVQSSVANTITFTDYIPFSYSANQWVYIRAQTYSQTLRVKVWLDGDPEPANWSYGRTHVNFRRFYTDAAFINGLSVQATGNHDFDIVQVSSRPLDTDFGEYQSGSAIPPNWIVTDEHPPNATWRPTSDGTAGVSGIRTIQKTDSSGTGFTGHSGFLYNRKRTEDPLEVLTKFQSVDTGEVGGLVLDATASGASDFGGYYFLWGLGFNFKLKRVLPNGGGATLLSQTSTAAGWVTNTWYWVRAKRAGNTLYGRVWKDGDAEPSTWDITYTDATPLATGRVGLANNEPRTTVTRFDSLKQILPTAIDISISLTTPSANVAETLVPTLNLTAGISIDTPIATATASGIDPTVGAVIRQDVSVDLSAVPLPGATIIAIDAIAGIGPSIPVPVVGTASGSAYVATVAPPDRFYTDFADQAVGDPPLGWTLASGTSGFTNSSGTVVSLAGSASGKALRLLNTGVQAGRSAALDWTALGPQSLGNVLVRFQGYQGSPIVVDLGYYWFFLSTASTVKISAKDNSPAIASGPLGFTPTATNWLWMRASIGLDLVARMKMWLDGTQEPAAWLLTGTIPEANMRSLPLRVSAINANYPGDLLTYYDQVQWTPGTASVDAPTLNLRYQVLPLIQKNLGLLWKATKAVDKSVGLKWSVAQAPVSVQKSVSLVWTGVQSVKVTTALSWVVAKEVVASRALRWVFSQEVDQKSRALVWNVRKLVPTSSIDLRWADVHTVDAPTKLALVWQDQLAVVQKLTTRWVTQSEGRVTLSRRMPWDTLATLRKDLRTRWSANLDALGALVEDFDTKSTGVLTPGHGLVVLDNRLRSIPEVQPGSPHYTDWSIVEDPFLFGGKALVGRGQAGGQSPGLLYFKNEPDPWEHDVVARIRLVASQPGVSGWQESIRRLNDYGKDPVYNQAQESGYALSNVGSIWRLDYGPTSVQSSSMILTFPDQAWIWTRVQVRRDVVNRLTQAKAKIWADGVPEPKDWMLDFTVGNMAGFPVDRNGNAITTGYTGQYTMFSGNIDVDRVSWTTPSSHVLEDAPAGAAFGFLEPVVALRQTVQAPMFIANASFPEPDIDIGDQVLVSWLVLEIPAPISVVEAIEVDDLGSASYTMLAPTVLAQAFLSIPVPIANPASFSMPAPLVVGHAGVGVAVDNVSLASISMPNPTVRVVARAVIFTDTALAQVAGLAPTLNTEFNARVDAVPASATFRMLKADSINGSREVEADLGVAGASMIPVQGVVATLSIHVDNATLAQAQMLPADARFGVSVPTSRATANASGLVPTVQTSISTVAPLVRASARMSDTALTRTSTRFPVGVTALVLAQMPEPFAQAFFTRVDVHVGGSAAFGLFAAVAPEFLSTPAAIGDALVLELGSTIAVVRLGSTMTDVQLGATLGVVELSDVRDEAKV